MMKRRFHGGDLLGVRFAPESHRGEHVQKSPVVEFQSSNVKWERKLLRRSFAYCFPIVTPLPRNFLRT